jgi:signal transduction histidine kinase
MKVTPGGALVLLLLLLLTWLLVSGLNLNSSRYDLELRALDDYSRLERGLNREVLTARVGLSRNYDALVRMSNALNKSLDRLREAAGSGSAEGPAIEALAAAAVRQQDLIERFKTRNALLQNSFVYFGILSGRLAASQQSEVAAVVTKLSAAMLRLTLDTSQAMTSEVQDRLNELAAVQAPSDEREFVDGVIAHGGVLRDLLPATDAILRALIAAASNPQQNAVRSLIVKRQLAARASARRYRVFLYATSLTLLAVLVYLGFQLRGRAVALRRRAAFEHVIARISARFINSQRHEIVAHVKCALGELAECIGADRAYFVVGADPSRGYHWLGDGIAIPPSWPGRALDLASRFDRGETGIIHIPRVKPSHHYDPVNLLSDAGLYGWLCVTNQHGSKVETILGFDALYYGALTQDFEVALLRMAFDAIANAVARIDLELEKERLEAKLQQARRMETVGAFASGIAHNFNNIVGAILGYTEMADQQVVSGDRSAGNLAEIRRAGERARDLVDQILNFGNRGDRGREHVDVKALFAETTALLAASLPSHVRLRVRETSERAVVSAEQTQLQQVFLNVCNNAAQAMDEPGVIDVAIETRETLRASRVGQGVLCPGRFVVTTISDPGRGMDEATLERIFEPFFTTRLEGNGLGLATANEIVGEYDGAMGVKSTIGAGTQFEIWLPSVTSSEPVPVHNGTSVFARGVGETILVLETDRARLLRNEEILAALGYEPVGFTAPDKAAEACVSGGRRFDAALLCQQPGSAAALDFARRLHGVAPSLPIILATPSARGLGAPTLAEYRKSSATR